MANGAGFHQVFSAHNAQPVPEFAIENHVDLRCGQRLRRTYLGRIWGGRLVLGTLAKSCGLPLYFRRTQGPAQRPRLAEIDAVLRRTLETRHRQLKRPGR